ncbi:MAG: 2-oxo acid dehydrogenase subunit E2 [Chlorobi bacterium]|nr:2-oxo acid dehydrogenase subunit E2 [Chlorobiota bacterium]
MATVVIMPKQGQSVESCIITEWNKTKGDKVAIGDVLFAYETDKASFEEEASAEGILLEVFFEEGDEVPVLTNVCVIGNEGEPVEEFRPGSDISEKSEKKDEAVEGIKPAPIPETKPAIASAGGGKGISPRARHLASSEAVAVEGIVGTGPEGRVIERDVKAIIENRPKLTPLAKKVLGKEGAGAVITGTGLAGTATGKDITSANPVYGADFEIKPLPNIRKLIAKAMLNSLRNSAQLTHHLGADARNILALREKVKEAVGNGYPTDITLNDMVCFAVVKALKQFPEVNAHFLGDSKKYFSKVHLALAVDTERGLMVPFVKNADDLSIQGLSNRLKDIAAACRKGSIDPELLAADAASFTVSNLGSYGVEMFTPVINLPQTAILGVNTIVPRPKGLGGGVYGFVPYMGLSLTYDHQSIDGGEATRFVKQVAIEIENLTFEI